jgi:putative membrane protein
MIVRPHSSWFRLLFVWNGSVLPRIFPRLLLVAAIAVLADVLRPWWIGRYADSALSIPTFTLLGVSLAIFLGFRNSVSYERYWEARKLWGGLLIAVRSLARQMLALAPDSANTGLFLDVSCAFVYAVKYQLRQEDDLSHLQRLLPAQLYAEVEHARFRPLILLRWMAQQNQRMRQSGEVTEIQWYALERNINSLSEMLGGCERIATTPIPFTYRVLLNRTVTIYCLLLPLGLVTSIGWLAPLISVFVAYTYLALETIAEELEEPFGKEGNDLPLAVYCHTIEASVREIQGRGLDVPVPQPQGIFLH